MASLDEDTFVACINCRSVLLDSEKFAGYLCRDCALEANALVCLTCRGHGDHYVHSRDLLGRAICVKRMCAECDGSGLRG
jgi:predicted RNA-binding Zn-ribbon protein involved in translation (DUF1610 family)